MIPRTAEEAIQHRCWAMDDHSWDIFYGPSWISSEWTPEDGWWLEINEQHTSITHCPYCGARLEVPRA